MFSVRLCVSLTHMQSEIHVILCVYTSLVCDYLKRVSEGLKVTGDSLLHLMGRVCLLELLKGLLALLVPQVFNFFSPLFFSLTFESLSS